MNLTKEEIGATAAAGVYALVVVIGLLRGVSLGELALRGGIACAGVTLLGQFLGGVWLRACDEAEEGPAGDR